MPKKILFESAVHQFLWAALRFRKKLETDDPAGAARLKSWLDTLIIENPGPGSLLVRWAVPRPGECLVPLKEARFYTRGDAEAHARRQAESGLQDGGDQVMSRNIAVFDRELQSVLAKAAVLEPGSDAGDSSRTTQPPDVRDAERKRLEEHFHDEWAAGVDVAGIDVRRMNEACTAPEMRRIRAALGDLRGKTLLDVGCGLGEASVYFALLGARVTATDISPGMCDTAARLAAANGVRISTHVSAAEDLGLPAEARFDIIYTGNTLHHVDIAATMPRLLQHLKPEGTFVSWDPVAYNPVINVYRRRATGVRTPDEHPLRLADIRAIKGCFRSATTHWYWLTTLSIFCIMAVVQRRNPNSERYWKKVVEEADRWEWLYRPLELLDKVLLVLPFLQPLCWNVVIVGKGPLQAKPAVNKG